MTKADIKAVKTYAKLIEKIKVRIAADRDELRNLLNSLDDIVSDIDDAEDYFETAVTYLNDGVELLSRQL